MAWTVPSYQAPGEAPNQRFADYFAFETTSTGRFDEALCVSGTSPKNTFAATGVAPSQRLADVGGPRQRAAGS